MKLILLMLALLSSATQAGSIIKCQAADGSITFADTRCPSGQQQLSKKTYQQRPINTRGDLKNLENGSEFPAETSPATHQSRMLFASRFVDALSATQAVRLSLLEYYLVNGEWPGSFEDMGLSGADMTSSTISKSHLLEKGRLAFSLVEAFGADKQIILAPEEVMSGTRIEWRCYSNFPADWLISPIGTSLCQSRYF